MKRIKKVLLIDDSKAVNSRNESLLKEMNSEVEITSHSHPKKAIEYLEVSLDKDDEDLPDIIFLDLNMPEMDGFSFLDNYIEIEGISKSDFKPLVVILSAHLEYENFEKSKTYKKYGVLAHVKKPMDKDDIQDLLDEYFD